MKIYFNSGYTAEQIWNCPDHPDAVRDANDKTKNLQIWHFPENGRSESEIVNWINGMIQDNHADLLIRSGSSILFTAIRAAVKEGHIAPENVIIHYLDNSGRFHEPKLDDKGRMDYWPRSFFETHANLLDRILITKESDNGQY